MADFSVSCNIDPNGITLSITGNLSIEHAADMRSALLDAFAEHSKVTVDISAAESIDLTGLQLMCAAHRTSIGLDKRLILVGSDQPAIRMTAERAGYYRHVGCTEDVTNTCVWIGEK